MKKVSVILPTYNRAAYVGDAVESVLQQTSDDLELIIVDDGSHDATEDAVAPFLADARVRYIRQNNAGVAAARNHGLEKATGECIAFIDSDDIWNKDKLKIQLAVLDAVPSASIVCSDFSARNSHTYIDHSHLRTYFTVLDTYHLAYGDVFPHVLPVVTTGTLGLREYEPVYWGNIYETMLFGNIILTSTTLFRRDVFEQTGFFDRSYRIMEDYDLFLKLTKKYDVALVDKPLVTYRYNENQISGDWNFGNLCDRLIDVFNKNVDGIRGTDFYRKNEKKLQQRLGMYQAQKAYFHFMHEDMESSATWYRESIRNDPDNYAAYVYLLFSKLPVSATRFVRRLKAAAA